MSYPAVIHNSGYRYGNRYDSPSAFDRYIDASIGDVDDIQVSSPSPPGRTYEHSTTSFSLDEGLDDYEDQIFSGDQQFHTVYGYPTRQVEDIYDYQRYNRNNAEDIMWGPEYIGAQQQQQQQLPQQNQWHQSQQNSPERGRLYQMDTRHLQALAGHRQVTPTPHTMVQDAPPTIARDVRGVRLRPVSELPDVFRSVFKFGVFNAVQSSCFDCVMHSSENVVISAPTGAGKTVLFELAIIRMLNGQNENAGRQKCVYMAPTKALCSERLKDWANKFDALGAKCCELTGDTVQFGKNAWGEARNANIIITTGEKWDSLTRNWGDHEAILSQVQLLLVDEIHILNETRGATLEVVISRMKTRSQGRVRFVLVSATVPNIADVAGWIQSGGDCTAPATVFQFDESYRPCKLTRHVHAYHRAKGQHDITFSRTLDYKLFGVLRMHTASKPVLVFCATRKGVLATAQQLAKEYSEAAEKRENLPWVKPKRIDHQFEDKRLNELAETGIGIHHAGLSHSDRRVTEDLYLKSVLRILVATSTLAVGVNLPAHTVVIKGVQAWCNNSSQEYSDLEIMQMLGRAGRPQFDREGVAIIMCETELENKYKALSQGTSILESCLHLNLAEHLNSEIGLGTITSVESAKRWVKSSFLFRRIQRNPGHYQTALDSGSEGSMKTWDEKIGDLVAQSVEKLQKLDLITQESDGGTEGGRLRSTEYGDIMSKFYIKQSTMASILKLQPRPALRDILETISTSEELAELKLRTSERTIYNRLRRHDDMRFSINKAETTAHKVFLLIQAVLGGIPLRAPEYKATDSQISLDAHTVFRHIPRIARAIVEVAISKRNGAQLKYGMEALRCLTAMVWEDRPVVLKQIPQIGEMSLKVLAEAGITTIDRLRKESPGRIELLLNRRAPFGHEIISRAREFPEYSLKVTELEVRSSSGKGPVEVDLSIQCGLAAALPHNTRVKQKSRRAHMTAVLTTTSDLEFIDFRRIPTRSLHEPKTYIATTTLTKPSQSIVVSVASECLAGVVLSTSYKPNLDPGEYPTPNTRPLNSVEAELVGLEDIPDFLYQDSDDIVEHAVTTTNLTRRPGETTEVCSNGASVKAVMGPIHNASHTPKKISNGNYECNHPCKDKANCRHLCCRDGLPDPPRKRKNDGAGDAIGCLDTGSFQQRIVRRGSRTQGATQPMGCSDQQCQRLDSFPLQRKLSVGPSAVAHPQSPAHGELRSNSRFNSYKRPRHDDKNCSMDPTSSQNHPKRAKRPLSSKSDRDPRALQHSLGSGPLFIPSSPEQNASPKETPFDPDYTFDDDFRLDLSFLDNLPATPEMTPSGLGLIDNAVKFSHDRSPQDQRQGLPEDLHFSLTEYEIQSDRKRHLDTLQVISSTTNEGESEELDPVAEFEAWLQSGSVRLVD